MECMDPLASFPRWMTRQILSLVPAPPRHQYRRPGCMIMQPNSSARYRHPAMAFYCFFVVAWLFLKSFEVTFMTDRSLVAGCAIAAAAI